MNAPTTVRDDTLRCSTCHVWKSDESFASTGQNPARRYRYHTCKVCQKKKREYREQEGVIAYETAERPTEMMGRNVSIFASWPTRIRQP